MILLENISLQNTVDLVFTDLKTVERTITIIVKLFNKVTHYEWEKEILGTVFVQ